MTTTILIAIAAFLVITLVLVALLLYAKAKLVASGEVTIDINNGERVITTESGSTLLSTLADNKVFLPSACGGGGSCGMCKCQVLEGGGDILPTETGFISRKLAKDHWRLGCQVKVKENLKIRVPEAVLGVKKWECTVVSNRNISTFLKEFVVKLPEGEHLKFRSGGYIQIDIPKYDAIRFSDMDIDERYREDWDKMKMWDLVTTNPEPTFRAYSMANHPAEAFLYSPAIFISMNAKSIPTPTRHPPQINILIVFLGHVQRPVLPASPCRITGSFFLERSTFLGKFHECI